MNNRRLLLSLALGLPLVSGASVAQNAMPSSASSVNGYGRGAMQHRQGDLSPEQRQQVQQIMQEEHERVRQRLSQVLTPDQMKRWDQRHQRMQHHDRMMDSWHDHDQKPMRPSSMPATSSSMNSDNT